MIRIKHLSVLLCLFVAIYTTAGKACSDAIPDNPSPADIHVKNAQPLSVKASYEQKFRSYQSAMDDYDFRRIITLFNQCAEAGDALCQYFLADGVSQWLWYDIYPHDKHYDAAFVRKWLRRASSDYAAYNFVVSDWASYYDLGALGFPKDRELYLCWREVSNSNNDMSKLAVKSRFDACRALELKKYGRNAHWLKD